MKLHKKITVNGTQHELVDESIQLSLFSPGRASFSIRSDSPEVKGVVIFYCGYQSSSLSPWFIGFVESCTQVDKKQVRIFCRELSAALYSKLPLALRDVTLADTLAAITNIIGVKFTLPKVAAIYLSNKAPAFYSLGGGYHAMDSLAEVYGIDQLIWQQQKDGKVFVGSWAHSSWASKPLTIARDFETEVTVKDGAKLPFIPAVRPGALYNANIITDVNLTGTAMQLQWAKNPWSDR